MRERVTMGGMAPTSMLGLVALLSPTRLGQAGHAPLARRPMPRPAADHGSLAESSLAVRETLP
jgi:hypothetical protein